MCTQNNNRANIHCFIVFMAIGLLCWLLLANTTMIIVKLIVMTILVQLWVVAIVICLEVVMVLMAVARLMRVRERQQL